MHTQVASAHTQRKTAVVSIVKIDPGCVWGAEWEARTDVDDHLPTSPRDVQLPPVPWMATRAGMDRWVNLVSAAQAHGATLLEAIAVADDIARSISR